MKKRHKTKNKYENGSTTFEAVAAIVILFFVLFAMLQIYRWCMTRQFCQYSAYYAAKGMSLGYNRQLIVRAMRVAGMSISGRRRGGGSDDEAAATNYMTYGDASGVNFENWTPETDQPYLRFYGRYEDENIYSNVSLRNDPLLGEKFLKMMLGNIEYDPRASVQMHNYANIYVKE